MERIRKFRCAATLVLVFCLLFPAMSQARGLFGPAGGSRIESSAPSVPSSLGTGSAFPEAWKSLLDILGGLIGGGTDDTPPEGDNRGGIDPNGVCGSNP